MALGLPVGSVVRRLSGHEKIKCTRMILFHEIGIEPFFEDVSEYLLV
jgi:hypothetical protein